MIGVVGTINSIDLGQPVAKERVYRPVTQQSLRSMALVLKTSVDPMSLVAQVRSAVQSIDPEQPIADVRTMDQWVARSLEGRRSPAVLLALFGAVALTLSAIGIYGVLAFSVAQRVREFGIRQALGADRRAILSLVLKQGVRQTAIGIVLGLVSSLWLTKYLQTLLFNVEPLDAGVFAAVTIMLLGGGDSGVLRSGPASDAHRSDGGASRDLTGFSVLGFSGSRFSGSRVRRGRDLSFAEPRTENPRT